MHFLLLASPPGAQWVDIINEMLNRPVAILMLGFFLFLFMLKRMNIDFPTFVAAMNSISSQPFALLVLIIGFWMLVECKKFGIDTTIAGGVIGVASNMLQSQLKDATHPPPGAAVRTQVNTEFTSPGTEAAPSDPKENL